MRRQGQTSPSLPRLMADGRRALLPPVAVGERATFVALPARDEPHGLCAVTGGAPAAPPAVAPPPHGREVEDMAPWTPAHPDDRGTQPRPPIARPPHDRGAQPRPPITRHPRPEPATKASLP